MQALKLERYPLRILLPERQIRRRGVVSVRAMRGRLCWHKPQLLDASTKGWKNLTDVKAPRHDSSETGGQRYHRTESQAHRGRYSSLVAGRWLVNAHAMSALLPCTYPLYHEVCQTHMACPVAKLIILQDALAYHNARAQNHAPWKLVWEELGAKRNI